MAFNPRWIIGKTVERVEMNPFRSRERYNDKAHNPRIYFTDGSSISFVAEETDFGEYGVDIVYRK